MFKGRSFPRSLQRDIVRSLQAYICIAAAFQGAVNSAAGSLTAGLRRPESNRLYQQQGMSALAADDWLSMTAGQCAMLRQVECR